MAELRYETFDPVIGKVHNALASRVASLDSAIRKHAANAFRPTEATQQEHTKEPDVKQVYESCNIQKTLAENLFPELLGFGEDDHLPYPPNTTTKEDVTNLLHLPIRGFEEVIQNLHIEGDYASMSRRSARLLQSLRTSTGEKPDETTRTTRKQESPYLQLEVAERWIRDMLKKQDQDLDSNEAATEEEDDDLAEVNELVTTTEALAESGVDRAALSRHFALPDELIDRLLRGLFVYSFGLREMLHSMVKHCMRGPQILGNAWDAYLSLLENADREQYESALASISIRDVKAETRRKTELEQRTKMSNREQERLSEVINEIQKQVRSLRDSQHQMEQQTHDLEARQIDVQSANEQCKDELERLLSELEEWKSTQDSHVKGANMKEAESYTHAQVREMLVQDCKELEKDWETKSGVHAKLAKMLDELNVKRMVLEPEVEEQISCLKRLSRELEGEARSKEVLKGVIKKQEQFERLLLGTELLEHRECGNLEARIKGQLKHNEGLQEAIKAMKKMKAELEEQTRTLQLRHGKSERYMQETVQELIQQRRCLMIEIAEMERSADRELDYRKSVLKHTTLSFEAGFEIGNLASIVSDQRSVFQELDEKRKAFLAGMDATEAEAAELVSVHEELQAKIQRENTRLAAFQQTSSEEAKAIAELKRTSKELSLHHSYVYSKMSGQLLDERASFSSSLNKTLKDEAEAQALVEIRHEYEASVGSTHSTHEALERSLVDMAKRRLKQVEQSEEMEGVCRELVDDARLIEKQLPPALAAVDTAQNDLMIARVDFTEEQRDLIESISSQEVQHRVISRDVDGLRVNNAVALAAAEKEHLGIDEDIQNTIEVGERAVALLEETAGRAVANSKMIQKCMSDIRDVISITSEEVDALAEVLQFERRLNLKASTELNRIVEVSENTHHVLKQHNYQRIQLRLQLLHVNEHRSAIEHERMHLEEQMRNRSRLWKQRQIEVHMSEAFEWRRRCGVHHSSCGVDIRGRDAQTQTEKQRHTMLSREAISAAPVLIGLERTFDAPLLVHEYPIALPRSIKLSIPARNQSALDSAPSSMVNKQVQQAEKGTAKAKATNKRMNKEAVTPPQTPARQGSVANLFEMVVPKPHRRPRMTPSMMDSRKGVIDEQLQKMDFVGSLRRASSLKLGTSLSNIREQNGQEDDEEEEDEEKLPPVRTSRSASVSTSTSDDQPIRTRRRVSFVLPEAANTSEAPADNKEQSKSKAVVPALTGLMKLDRSISRAFYSPRAPLSRYKHEYSDTQKRDSVLSSWKSSSGYSSGSSSSIDGSIGSGSGSRKMSAALSGHHSDHQSTARKLEEMEDYDLPAFVRRRLRSLSSSNIPSAAIINAPSPPSPSTPPKQPPTGAGGSNSHRQE